MINLSILKVAGGCGITDYLLDGEVRDFCDMWVVCGGIALILFLIYLKRSLVEKRRRRLA